MAEKYKNKYGFLALSLFVFWLLSFPMCGPLLENPLNDVAIFYFLTPHSIFLAIIGFFLNQKKIDIVYVVIILVTSFLTLIFPFVSFKPTLLIILGILSSFIIIKIVLFLANLENNILLAGLGISLGNFLVLIFSISQIPKNIKFFIISVGLAFTTLLLKKEHLEEQIALHHESSISYIVYIILFFVFYFIGGLMYNNFLPLYTNLAYLQNFELLFYILGALAGIYFVKKDRDLTIAIGILLMALSLSFFKIETRTFSNLGMFFSQLSFGFFDLLLISILIMFKSSLRKISIILTSMTLGILTGQIFSFHLKDTSKIIIESGNIVLIVSALTLYFLKKNIKENKQDMAAQYENFQDLNFYKHPIYKNLSEQELKVLKMVLQDKKYTEIAAEMKISVSTVKTYMKRICDKTGCPNKEEIIKNLHKKE